MSKKATGAEPHLKVVSRPSLYTTDMPQNDQDKKVSILASLEPDRSTRTLGRGGVLSILLIMLFGAVSYWAYVNAIFERPLVVPAWVETAFNISKTPRPAAAPVNQAVSGKLASVADKQDEPMQAPVATIVTEMPSATIQSTDAAQLVQGPAIEANQGTGQEPAQVATQVSQPGTDGKLASLDALSGTDKKGDAPPLNTVAATAQTVSNQGAAPSSQTDAELQNKLVVAKPEQKVTRVQPKARQAKTKNAKDEDVELIAALLSRVSRPETTNQNTKRRTSGTTAKSGKKSSAKKQNKEAPTRDIVARAPEESTESLLNRCKTLGFFEGELCRFRICSNQWGVNPACPAMEQTKLIN